VSPSDQLLAAFTAYGLPVLFGVVLFGSAGAPVPGVLLVIAAGALVEQGEMNLWWVIALVSIAAIVGDNLGYWVGRLGGRRLANGITGRLGGQHRLDDAEVLAKRWGGFGIFLSRWLLTPLGSALNLVSGIAAYPYPRFFMFDVAGEVLWAIEYVLLGELLSNRIANLAVLLGDLSWVVVGLAGAALFGSLLVRYLRNSHR
jgi:membrane protein DedA with SNARE-associated domain